MAIDDYPGLEGDLRGCVNDARAWARLLVEHFGAEAKLLLNAQATRLAILGALDRLLETARPGDLVVFTSSSHGTYVADTDGDEQRYDEAFCPYDYRSNLIIDDELRERFAALPNGVQIVFVADTCHAGTVSRQARAGSEYRRARFLAPEEWGGRSLPEDALRRSRARPPESAMREIRLAGCKASQYAYDALLGGTYHGAMTYFALQAIREQGLRLTYSDLHARLCELLVEASFPQDPRLEGRDESKKRLVFSV